MDIVIEDNANCPESGHFVFNEMEEAREIKGLITSSANGDVRCDVVAVGADGAFSGAHARKINDSGDAVAFLIYGGEWGIRLRPKTHQDEPWDITNERQWGEPYKVYGKEEDIIFE